MTCCTYRNVYCKRTCCNAVEVNHEVKHVVSELEELILQLEEKGKNVWQTFIERNMMRRHK